MISFFCLAHKRLLEEAQANLGSTIPFAPEYADDGFKGRAIDEVLKLFQEELRLAEEYGLRYDLNSLSSCWGRFPWRCQCLSSLGGSSYLQYSNLEGSYLRIPGILG